MAEGKCEYRLLGVNGNLCGKPEVARRIENVRFPPDSGPLVESNISGR